MIYVSVLLCLLLGLALFGMEIMAKKRAKAARVEARVMLACAPRKIDKDGNEYIDLTGSKEDR